MVATRWTTTGAADHPRPVARRFHARFLPHYWALLFLVAYTGEGLWDSLVWREHAILFPVFATLPGLENGAVPALS